jgi:hypothetical protein
MCSAMAAMTRDPATSGLAGFSMTVASEPVGRLMSVPFLA